MKWNLILLVFFVFGCPPKNRYPQRYYLNVTAYKPDLKNTTRTPSGIRYWAPSGIDIRVKIDRYVAELEQCLGEKIRRDWFGVYIPKDAYLSACSGKWLVPSTPHCQLCRDKGLKIPDECCGKPKPTVDCMCVCNMRSVVQDNWLIITTRSLEVFKAELARLVTGINNPWSSERIRKCLVQ